MATNEIDIINVENLPAYQSESAQIEKISAEKLLDLGKKAKARLDELKNIRLSSRYEEERQKDFEAYHMIPPRKPLPYVGYPNMACPLPRIGTDTFHANVMFTFGGQEGQFNVLPDFLSSQHMDEAKRAAQYMTYVLNYEAGLYMALDKADMDCNKYENGFLKARYVIQEEWVTRIVESETVVSKVDPETKQVTRDVKKTKKRERVKEIVFDGVKVERLNPANVYASPFFETVADAVDKDYLFEVEHYNVRFLEENTIANGDDKPFFNKAAVDEIKTSRRNGIVSRLERNKQQYDGYQVDMEVTLSPVELAEAHFRTDIDGDGLAEKVALVFDTETGIPVRASFAKCRIVKLTPRPIDGRWDGESVRKVASTLVTEWEAIHNQRVAKGQWSNLPFFFYKSGGRFNPQAITLMPGKGYPLEDPSSVNFPQVPPPDPSYFNEEQLIMNYFDRVLALGDVIQGLQGKGDASATNTIQSTQKSGIRLANPINRIGFALHELVAHIWDLNKLCAPEVKEFKVAGIGDGTPIFKKMSRTDYNTQVGFKLNMATLADVQMVRDTAMLNYRTFITNPMVTSNPASFYQLTQNTMDALGVKVKIPQPDQAKVKSVFEIIDLIEDGQQPDPTVGIDPDEHMAGLKAFMESPEFEEWSTEQKMALYLYYDKVQILKQTLQSANLNQSGVFEGMNGVGQPPQGQPGNGPVPPTMTASRNPSQTMNRMRVSNSPQSMRANANQTPMAGGANVVSPQVPVR